MLHFEKSAVCRAPAVEVWKFLHDPVRFSEWWAGVSRAEVTADGTALYADGRPDLAIPTRVTAGRGGRDVVIKCLATQDVFTWTLEPHARGCRVSVRVQVADNREDSLRERRAAMVASLPRLVAAAEAAA